MVHHPEQSAVKERYQKTEKRRPLLAQLVQQLIFADRLGQFRDLQFQHQQGHGDGENAVGQRFHSPLGKQNAVQQLSYGGSFAVHGGQIVNNRNGRGNLQPSEASGQGGLE